MIKMSREQVERADNFMTILHQRKWWRNGRGTALRRRDMPVDYQLNALAYLVREARRIVADYCSQPQFIVAPDDVDAELERMLADPERTVLDTPMARALLQDIMSFADIGPEDLGLGRINNLGLVELAENIQRHGVFRTRRAMDGQAVWVEKAR